MLYFIETSESLYHCDFPILFGYNGELVLVLLELNDMICGTLFSNTDNVDCFFERFNINFDQREQLLFLG